MKHCFLICWSGIVWLMVLTNSLRAQDVNRDFVILSSGQQVYGQVIRDFDYSQYRVINFISPLGEKFAYQPKDIQGFGLDNGRIFYSKILPGMQEKVFVQQMLTGSLSLLSYKGNFFIEGEKEITELVAGYEKIEFDSRTLRTYKKPFIGTLKILMAGICGTQLSNLINRTNYSEQDFVEILSKYHLCEGLDFKVHIAQIKRVRLSPYLGAGYTLTQTSVNNRTSGRKDVLENAGMPFVLMGLKVYQFRNLPKIGFDLGLGFAFANNRLDSEYINPQVSFTGTEEFKFTSVYAPVFLNYSFHKSKSIESYLGLGAFFRFNTTAPTYAIKDLTTNYNAATVLEEHSFLTWKKSMVNPSIKIGTHINAGKPLGFLVELQMEYAPSAFSAELGLNKASYNQLMGSLFFAIRY